MATGDVYDTTAQYLMQNGYSKAAASGIAGDIAGESAGNPEAVGDNGTSFGLIQLHGSQYSNLVTGNQQADYNAQLPAILNYNNQQGAGYLRELNAQTDPVAAAQYYSLNFERPAQQYSDVRPDIATQVFNELGGVASGTGSVTSANPTATLTASTTGSTSSGLAGILGLPNLSDLMQRLGLILLGAVLIVVGIYMLAGKQILAMTPAGEMLSHSGRVSRQRRNTSDERYEAAESRRQNRETRQQNTGQHEERRLALRERRVALAEATEARKAAREAANP